VKKNLKELTNKKEDLTQGISGLQGKLPTQSSPKMSLLPITDCLTVALASMQREIQSKQAELISVNEKIVAQEEVRKALSALGETGS
jgi:flagellar motility protein MotE (MotC chaperone)